MFKIIRFTYHSSMYSSSSDEMTKKGIYKSYLDVEIPMGASRVGGCVVDLPPDMTYPEDLLFMAQLNLNDFSRHDPFGLLPKSGFLFFFIGGYGDIGKVCFSDIAVENLTRKIKEDKECFGGGCLIDQIYNEEEDFDSRYNEEWGNEDEERSVRWDPFAGTEKSKIYGIYTHCQMAEEEIIEIANSENLLLLQIGEDFNLDGVWSVLINRNDLENRVFDRCQFEWGQS